MGSHRNCCFCFLESYIKAKIVRLNDALDDDPVDVELLRKMMISSEGCVTNDLRCKVWPKLLNVDVFNQPRKKRGTLVKAVLPFAEIRVLVEIGLNEINL